MTEQTRRHTVLILDDEPDLCKIASFILERSHFETFTETDVNSALEILKTEKIDIILSDIKMPGMSGIRFAKKIRKELSNPPPIIFITGSSGFVAQEAYEAGAEAVFLKPINYPAVISAIHECLSSKRKS